jgi:hypothetical protein
MNCPQFDWKGYSLGELERAAARGHEEHLAGCATCREELARLSVALNALRTLPQAEMPRRITFVSDPVFEPGPWARFWASPARLGFAAAAMLSCAIMVHAFAPRQAATPADFEARVNHAVELRVAALQTDLQKQREADLRSVDNGFQLLQRQLGVMYVQASRMGGD